MYITNGVDDISGKYKELIVSYKVIYINTYNILLSDISSDIDTEVNINFRHESFQSWESEIQGLYLQKNKEFVTASKFGLNVVGIGQKPKRLLKDNEGKEKMLHALDS